MGLLLSGESKGAGDGGEVGGTNELELHQTLSTVQRGGGAEAQQGGDLTTYVALRFVHRWHHEQRSPDRTYPGDLPFER